MGTVLRGALSTVQSGHNAGGGGRGGRGDQTGVARTIDRSENETGLSSGQDPFFYGLRGVCRALFHHCVGAIGFVSPAVEDALEGHGVSRGAVMS